VRPGQLLVATPLLQDPNFLRTVVYLFSTTDGTAGVILNRPSEIPVSAILATWATAAANPAVVHFGGPVAMEHAIALSLSERTEAGAGGIEIIDLESDPADVAPGSIRVFSGYAGWGRGQVEQEIEDSSWFVVDSTAHDLVDADPSRLWKTVLSRQRPPINRFANYPDDPYLN
jgi:putative transcriptional regulator